jgi:O-acetyl-ADP-ribose deacetylase (regulator of RNase III)
MPEAYKQTVREGLQQRELKYGHGENKRVWEVDYKGVKIGINLGDIASAPTEAIMCPTTPWLEVGGGSIENRIADVAGNEVFETYTKELIGLLTQIRGKNTQASLSASERLIQFLAKNTGMKVEKSSEEVRSEVLQATATHNLGEDVGEHVALFYGGSIPAPAGKELGKKGIKIVVLTNVTPEGKKMEAADMVQFTKSAAQAASLTGVDSLTIPAVGTGFAAAFGFGMTQAESMVGFFKGATEYIAQNQSTSLRRIDYNMYAQPTSENAKQVSRMLQNLAEATKLLS